MIVPLAPQDAGRWPDPLDRLAAVDRAAAGLHRTLRPRRAGSPDLLDVASTDYLGAAQLAEICGLPATAAALAPVIIGEARADLARFCQSWQAVSPS